MFGLKKISKIIILLLISAIGIVPAAEAQVTPQVPRILGKRIKLPPGQPGLHRREVFNPVQTRTLDRQTWRASFSGGCARLNQMVFQNMAGFYNVELDNSQGDACGSGHVEVALLFDLSAIKNYGGRVISAELRVTQSAYPTCDWIVIYTNIDQHCYSSGSGQPEAKPRGCFAVEVPSAWPTGPVAARALGFATLPGQRYELNNAGMFDVTAAINRQVSGVLGASPGAGLLLKPYLTSNQLSGQDNTKCLSAISKITLVVTYEVPPAGVPPLVR